MDSNPNDPTYNPPQPDVIPPVSAAPAGGLSDNTAAALAYVTVIPAIVFLVMEPYNRSAFIRFHSIQCISLFVVWIVWVFAQMLILWIPIIGILISILVALLFFGTWAFTLYKASQGEWFKIPVLGDFAMKQAKA